MAAVASPAPRRFRISARAVDEAGCVRFVNLGSCEASAYDRDVERLKADVGFLKDAMRRFHNKRPGWRASAVLAKLGTHIEVVDSTLVNSARVDDLRCIQPLLA